MAVQRFLTIAILSSLALSACSAETQSRIVPQQRSLQASSVATTENSNVPASLILPVGASSSAHFLYVTAGSWSGGKSALIVYKLPLTATSQPVDTMADFAYAAGVGAGDTNLIVADNQPTKSTSIIKTPVVHISNDAASRTLPAVPPD